MGHRNLRNDMKYGEFCLSEGARSGYCKEKVVVLHVMSGLTKGRHRTTVSGGMRLAYQGGSVEPEHPVDTPLNDPPSDTDFYVSYH